MQDANDGEERELPASVIDEAERLTRAARAVVDADEREVYRTRRAELLAQYSFRARVRTDEGGAVLVLHPSEWHEDGVIRTDRIEDLSRAIEVTLEGPGDPDDWETLEAENRALAAAVEKRHGEVHGKTANALADFMSNHYSKPITETTARELAEFRNEYFIRNAWPSEKQREHLSQSLELIFETAEKPMPGVGVQ